VSGSAGFTDFDEIVGQGLRPSDAVTVAAQRAVSSRIAVATAAPTIKVAAKVAPLRGEHPLA